MGKRMIVCAQCGVSVEKDTSQVNRSHRRGAPTYCGLACVGIARRSKKSLAQKKEDKRLYDLEYRDRWREKRLAQKKEYHRRTYDPVKASQERKKRMQHHVEFCRRPEYRAYKRRYDRQYWAKKNYGLYWECFILADDIRKEVLSHAEDYDIRSEKDTLNKCAKRRRDYARSHGKEPERRALANADGGQER